MASRKPERPAPLEPPISDSEFRRLCEFLYRRTGLSYGEGKRYFVDRRLRDRMAATGSDGFQSYFNQLVIDPGEVERLINAFTVNETYFYREEHQFRCLTGSLLDRITARKRPGETIRIWSLPCSTGEEPYSIAIWLLENWPRVDDWDVEIVGSDIDTEVLEAAEAGVYSARSLMRLQQPLIDRYFERTSDGRFRIDEALRGSVRFGRVNVADAVEMGRYRGFDVVFCRNLLIYFDEISRRQAAENIYDSLLPSGYVCLGHTESMSRISSLFRVCRFPDAIVYQKPAARDDA